MKLSPEDKDNLIEESKSVYAAKDRRARFVKSIFIPLKKPSSPFGIASEFTRDLIWQLLIRNVIVICHLINSYTWRRWIWYLMGKDYPDLLKRSDQVVFKFLIRDNINILRGHKLVVYCQHCDFNNATSSLKENDFTRQDNKGNGLCYDCRDKGHSFRG